MKHLKKQRSTLVVVLCLAIVLTLSAIATAGIATSPLGAKPLAGLGSCPLGAVHQPLAR